MRPIVCPTCLTSPNASEVIVYSKPHHQVGESIATHKKHRSARSQTFPNRVASSSEKPVWSLKLKLLIRRVFGVGGRGTSSTCCRQKPNVNCYRRKVLLAVERKHKIMQRDVVRARRTSAYGTTHGKRLTPL